MENFVTNFQSGFNKKKYHVQDNIYPGEEVLRRTMSPYVYPGERYLFTNFLHPVNKSYLGEYMVNYFKSTSGHIVVRVYPAGNNYDVFILDDQTRKRHVIARYSYESE